MYAIINEGGGQRKVVQGDEILIDLVDGGTAQVGKAITFKEVLLVGGAEGGGNAKIGKPFVPGASVTAEITEAVVLGEKLTVQYFQPKKGSRRRTGHRQRYTKVKVTGIAG
ncbi:MAG TPA: 50S ribosomal protein L21 [Phycisphaerales bacterium]|jgi:large subunit ribosomal protein L21|nr:50S ribosomal protein L21 [Phycisphaerales bacterium]